MTCKLNNTCDDKHLCCHFCKEKCFVRCKDKYKKCSWLEDEQLPLFTLKQDADGNWTVKHYVTQLELFAKAMARLRITR